VTALAGTAHASVWDDALAGRCQSEPRLLSAATEALAHHSPIDDQALRDRAHADGMSVPTLHTWVGRGDDAPSARTAARWLADLRPTSIWARCAVAHQGDLHSVVVAPRAAELSGVSFRARSGDRTRPVVALPANAHDVRVDVARPDGIVEPVPSSGYSLIAPGTHVFQATAETAGGRLTFARWEIVVEAAVSAQSAAAPATVRPAADTCVDVADVVRAINRERAAAGARPLRTDPVLTSIARARAERLAAEHRVAHRLDQADDPALRLADSAVAADALAENVARAPTVCEAHRGLAASPSHRANRQNPLLESIGHGWARDSERQLYFVEILATHARIVDMADERP